MDEEVRLLLRLAEGIDWFINYSVLPEFNVNTYYVLPESYVHDSMFYIGLLDLFHKNNLLEDNDVDCDFKLVAKATGSDLSKLTSSIIDLKMWIYSIYSREFWFCQKEIRLKSSRYNFIYCYANIKKHIYFNLDRVSKRIEGISDPKITQEEILYNLDEIEEHLKGGEMHWWRSKIISLLIAIRLDLSLGLERAKKACYVKGDDGLSYSWMTPEGIPEIEWARLMNLMRAGPIFKEYYTKCWEPSKDTMERIGAKLELPE
jgi:hypothetical protein